MLFVPAIVTGAILMCFMVAAIYSAHIPVIREFTGAAPLETGDFYMCCNQRMARIGGPGHEVMYACYECGARRTRTVPVEDQNHNTVEDGFWSRVFGSRTK